MRVLLSIIAFSIACSISAHANTDLSKQVVIRKTDYGIPHILGETEKAAAYGFAWVQCEDHFPLLYKSMVRGRGELSRWYGGSDSHIQFDFQTRLLRARDNIESRLPALPTDYADVLSGFAEGINAYMAAHPNEVKPWMTPVTSLDVAAAWEVAIMRFTFLRGNVIERYRNAITNSSKSIEFEEEESVGSNMIALSPKRSKSGHAMLLNNPHQPWSEEARYYEAHITVPGKYNFYGSTFIGGHILTTGFSEYLGWTHTVNYPDLSELYKIKMDPEKPNHYLFDGQSIPLEHKTVSIQIDGNKKRSQDMWWSPLGPVVYKDTTFVYILRAAGYQQKNSGIQWYRMAQARNLTEFRDALRMQSIPMFNVGYADRDGNIYYLWNGMVPKLPHDGNRYEAVSAAGEKDIWTEFHPLEELMQVVNPMGGYVQNCNSPPYFTNLYTPLKRSTYPTYFPENALSIRTQHGLNLVHNDKMFSLEDLVDAKYSMNMLLADRIKDELIALLSSTRLTKEEQSAVELLQKWDNSASAHSRGSVLFKIWWAKYRQGDAVFSTEWTPDQPTTTPAGIGSPNRAIKSFRDAMKECTERWGNWDIRWGAVHRVQRGEYNLPVGGGDRRLGCFRVCEYSENDNGQLVMRGGDGFVFAVEFANQPKAYSVLAYSQSGRPESPHYADQTWLFCSNKMKVVAFSEDAIKDQLITEYRPK